ncbi:hypothetical protein ACWNX2_00490 [Candidatus Vidania fulgoroideorum]
MVNLVRILIKNEYQYLHTFYHNKGLPVPIRSVSYIRFISCIVPAFVKILFYLKRNINTKFLVFMDRGCRNYRNFRSLLYSKIIVPNTCFNEAVLRYSLLKNVKLFIILSETLDTAFLKAALKNHIKVIYVTNSFKPILYKPFLFLRCNVASYRMRFHFIKQIYYLKKFTMLASTFFNLENVKYFLFTLSCNSILVISLLFKEFLYYNRFYITYVFNKLFSNTINLNIYAMRTALCTALRKFYCIYNERFSVRFCKRFVFPMFSVRFYCHNGMYTCFCIYRSCSAALIDQIMMHFVAYKDLLGADFLNVPFVFDTHKPISHYVCAIKGLRVFFLK